MKKKELPILRGFVKKDNNNGLLVLDVFCPFCDSWHRHGYDKEDKNIPSHRAAHCIYGKESPFKNTGYYIAPFIKKISNI